MARHAQPRWAVTRSPKVGESQDMGEYVWWADRHPHPEDSGLTYNDRRMCINGGSFATWQEAQDAANEGAALDAQYGQTEVFP